MKPFLSSIIGLLTLLFPVAVPVLAQDEAQLSPTLYLDQIRAELNLGEDDQLHCEDVTKDQRVKLGEVIYNSLHPNASQEALLRKLMGMSEKSPEEMYLRMGSRFIGCENVYGPEAAAAATTMPCGDSANGQYKMGGYMPMGMGMMGMMWGQEFHWGNYLGFLVLHGIGWLIFLAFSVWIVQKIWKRS